MDAILFIHHLGLNDPVTRKHLALLKALNRDSEVIPLAFDRNRETPLWQWKNCDILIYEWFDRVKPKHERYFVIEWDCFCTQSLHDFYGDAINQMVVGATVIRPWSDEIMLGTYGEPIPMRRWHWFAHNTSPEIYPYLRGIMPTCGTMFRHDALFNMVQLWKTNHAFDALFNECRIGTLAAMAGYEPQQIRPDAQKFLHSGDVEIDGGVGIFHRVRL